MRIKLPNEEFVAYVIKEIDYFSLINPGTALQDTNLIAIAREYEPLLVVFQDRNGNFQFEKIVDALQKQIQLKQNLSAEFTQNNIKKSSQTLSNYNNVAKNNEGKLLMREEDDTKRVEKLLAAM